MAPSVLLTLDGKRKILPTAQVDQLRQALRGDLLSPESPRYDEVRQIWNAMIDRRPGLIACCASEADVIQAVNFARDNSLLVAVRGGGHNIAGTGVCEHGLLIDLSPMKGIHIDPDQKVARVEPGCILADFDHDAQIFGLATPLGINSTTGVAGLTLGGGFGWLSRQHGLTIDNLLAAEIVTADGRVIQASAENHPDLFWAIRGGGGNFGVVTSFTFRLHPVGPTILSGLIVHPLDHAADLLRRYRELAPTLPENAAAWVVLRKAPPLPFLPAEWHGREVLVFAGFYNGNPDEGERVLAPLRKLGKPIADVIGPHPYSGWQQAFDPLLTRGARNYWKTHDLDDLSDPMIETLVNYVSRMPSPQSEIFIGQLGGKISRVGATDTAYPARGTRYVMNVHGRWEDPVDDGRIIGWAREFLAATAPFANGDAYVNFLTSDEGDRIKAAYGPNYARLAKIKRQYDPENLFRMNHNIRPEDAG